MTRLDALLSLQSGVVTRGQLVEVGVSDAAIRRMLRRRDLVDMPGPRGIYVNHTGEPQWIQQAWAGVLALWPAALCHQSALRADDGPGRRGRHPLHIAVDRTRSPAAPPGVRLHQLAHLDQKAQWNLAPPRVRIEQALIDVAAEARDDLEAISVLADAVQARRTTAPRLLEALATRQRLPRRRFLAQVLHDISHGTCSVLEHGYLTLVERPHGLPVGERQVRESPRGLVFRDVVYRRFRRYVELDGRPFHDNARARDLDLDRDLDAEVDGHATTRLGWGQVFGRSCLTAHRIGRLLQMGGWDGTPQRCPACPSGLRALAA